MLLELKNVFLNEGEQLTLSEKLDLSSEDFYGIHPFSSPVEVKVFAKNQAGAIILQAEVAFDFSHPCDRCAEEFTKRYTYSFEHKLVTSLHDDSSEEYILVEDYQLDLDELLRTDILLELPTKFLCRPDCKGICPQCGINRNQHTCSCVMHQVDPRLEVLKQLID